MAKLLLFLLVSMGSLLLSRKHLMNRRSHGFFRLLAFETILALFLLNVDKQSQASSSPPQILSWVLLILSAGIALHAFYMLSNYGGTEGSVENTTVIVRRGIFRWIRHPLYTSLLLFAWGVFFKSTSLLSSLLVTLSSLFLFLTGKAEENESLVKFGEEYLSYMKSTKMFIPYLF